jgi:hypothetical protein
VKESVLDKIEKKIYTNPCKSNWSQAMEFP